MQSAVASPVELPDVAQFSATVELDLEHPADKEPEPKGKRWYPPIFTGEPRQVTLSPRMADVLVGVMKGLPAKKIGKVLFITEDTVKTHAKRLYRALGAANQAHAVALFTTGEVEVYVTTYAPGRRRRLIALAPGDDEL